MVSEGKNLHMNIEVGETLVYPHHGAAKIVKIENREFAGEKQKHLQLKVSQGDLLIWVPFSKIEAVGIRAVIDNKGVKKVVQILQAEFVEEPTNWSRRYKANLEKLQSGDVNKNAEVVRDLWRRDQDRGLSAGEKRMLAKARQILISELALAKKFDEEKAGTFLDTQLAGKK
jgi:CarD family transcriptional regulator